MEVSVPDCNRMLLDYKPDSFIASVLGCKQISIKHWRPAQDASWQKKGKKQPRTSQRIYLFFYSLLSSTFSEMGRARARARKPEPTRIQLHKPN